MPTRLTPIVDLAQYSAPEGNARSGTPTQSSDILHRQDGDPDALENKVIHRAKPCCGRCVGKTKN